MSPTYSDAPAFRTALEARIKNRADGAFGVPRLRKQVIFERLLARRQDVAPDAWTLKGGFALELRAANRARFTKDMDIDWKIDEAVAVSAVVEAGRADLGDYFEFRLERVRLPADIGGPGQRWRATARLAGRTFEQAPLDIGFSAEPVLAPERLELSPLLAFAGVRNVSVPVAALEQHLAEKLHAYTRRYAGDRPSSRVKDLIDILLIGGMARLGARALRGAINELFARRMAHAPPSAVPRPPVQWAAPYAELAREVGLPAQLGSGYVKAAQLLDPVLGGDSDDQWDPDRWLWAHTIRTS